MTAQPDPFEPDDVVWTPVSRRLIGKRLVNLAIPLAVALVAACALALAVPSLWSWGLVAAVAGLGGWLAWLIPRQVKALAYAERHDDLLIRRGIMFRSLVVVPYGRLQFVDVEAGPVDRWFKVAVVQLHTASAHTDAAIPGLGPQEAARLRDRLAARGEARLAGL